MASSESSTNNNSSSTTPSTPAPATTPELIHFTEAQVQNLVTMIFQSVNTRISDRIVQTLTDGDTAHTASAGAVKAALDAKVQELSQQILGINNWNIVTVTGTLPATLAEKTIYLQRDSASDPTWEMNINVGGQAVNIGNTSIDLANYWAKDNMDGLVNALFASSLFGTKIGTLINTALQAYTTNTLDARYKAASWEPESVNLPTISDSKITQIVNEAFASTTPSLGN